MGNDEDLSQAFNYFDKNQSGYIEFDELKEALLEDNLGPNKEQIIHEILFDVDLDKVGNSSNTIFFFHANQCNNVECVCFQDGRVSYQEFKAMMKSGTDWKMASRQYSRVFLNALSIKLFKDKSMELLKTPKIQAAAAGNL